jgi:hypothetical protein
MDKLKEDELTELYTLRTRHLLEFNTFYDKIIHDFERIINGEALEISEKTTFREYAILRDIASLSPYVHYFDEEMLQQLPAEKIKKCQNIVDYFEAQITPSIKNTLFREPSSKSIVLLDANFFIRLDGFVALALDKNRDRQNKPSA